MSSVYILYSISADLYYTGSTKDQEQRLIFHLEKEFKSSFTSKYSDWELYFSIENLNISTARKIESHVKKMKSKIYIQNLKRYPEMVEKLIARFS
jgi:putative endonuclease